MFFIWISISILILFIDGAVQHAPIVTLDDGELVGTVKFSQTGRQFYAFLGIPYAASPIEDKRFRAPEPFGSWEGIRNCSEESPLCLQVDKFTSKVAGIEDCLFLNIYTHKLLSENYDDKSRSAVLVFFHGGAFAFGVSTPTFRGPGRLMERDVVLVTVNYRLGPLGFLSTLTASVPGNYGMLDQVMALKWVQKNIVHFGGDAQRVTLFGDSAGGASVLYHFLSPLSKGLFHRGIAMSGSPLCPWALQERPHLIAKRLASDIGCPPEESSGMMECMRSISARSLVTKAHTYFKFSFLPITFAPVVDKQSGNGSFLPEYPRKLLQQGIINPGSLMIGITKDEGAFVYAEILSENQTTLLLPKEIKLLIQLAMDEEQKERLDSDHIEKYYFPETAYYNSTILRTQVIKFLSDCLFRACHFETIHWFVKNGRFPYVYSHDYKPEKFTVTQFFGITEDIGVGHVDYLPFLFDGDVFGHHTLINRDLIMSKLLTKLWSNFASNGIPTGENETSNWKSASSEQYDILSIDIPLKLHKKINTTALRLWNPAIFSNVEPTKWKLGIFQDILKIIDELLFLYT